MTWIIKELQLSLLHSALLYINRGLHSTKRKKIPSAFGRSWKVKKQAAFVPCIHCFSLVSCLISLPAPHASTWSDTHSGFLHDICRILWSCLIRPYPNHAISSATTFFLCIHLPHPNIFFFLRFFFFSPCFSPGLLSTWNWHYQLISHNAHSTA